MHPARERFLEPTVAAVAAGGALGALARYALTQRLRAGTGEFPWGTFTANVAGAFVLGAFVVVIERFRAARWARAFFAVGVLGAFTTFSSLAMETVLLVKYHDAGLAVVYLLASLAAGLALAAAGLTLARRVSPGSRVPR
jgi:CrcB protein